MNCPRDGASRAPVPTGCGGSVWEEIATGASAIAMTQLGTANAYNFFDIKIGAGMPYRVDARKMAVMGMFGNAPEDSSLLRLEMLIPKC